MTPESSQFLSPYVEADLYRSVILGCSSTQDDATVKCWGWNINGQLGLGDTFNRGDDADGPCPPSFTTVSLVPSARVLTLTPLLRVQEWGRTSLRSTWGLGGRPWPSLLEFIMRVLCW